jgi:hypothetical protein
VHGGRVHPRRAQARLGEVLWYPVGGEHHE